MSLRGRGAYFTFFYIISDVEREEAWRGWALCVQYIQIEVMTYS
jgi:hypothetical protein